ncbi:MAG TPA: hypothetical protein ENI65_04135 [Gammaproteobacteria bacterium]|nr:hypothetical protein [Gammaproteobacteria bacterium]
MNNEVKKSLLSRASVPLIIILFVSPMVAAWIVFNYFPDSVRGLGTTNKGEFITPPVKVSVAGYKTIEGKTLPEDYFSKKWTFVYINSGKCSNNCFDHLMLLKNVRLTQGKEISRIKRLFVIDGKNTSELFLKNMKNYPGMDTVPLSTQKMQEDFFQAFRFEGNTDPANAGYVYVVDPSSQVMMYYKNDKGILMVGKDMQKDMSTLLRNSQLRK